VFPHTFQTKYDVFVDIPGIGNRPLRYLEQRLCGDGRREGTKYTAIVLRRARPILNFQKQDAKNWKKKEKEGMRGSNNKRLKISREGKRHGSNKRSER
jgi:hypothetical protein